MNFLEAYEENKTKKVICLDNNDTFDIDKMRSETTWYVDHIEGKWSIFKEPKPKVIRWLWAVKRYTEPVNWVQDTEYMTDFEAEYRFRDIKKTKIDSSRLEFED